MSFTLMCIVEGCAEVSALPILVRRIQQASAPTLALNLPRPIRRLRNQLVKAGGLEEALEFAARQAPSPRGILMLIDADRDCPAILGPQLLARAQTARPDVLLSVVLAKCEFEAWFLAAFESLSSKRGLAERLSPVPNPEDVRGAKEYLSRHMVGNASYRPTIDQPALTAVFDMNLARSRSDSFDKCWREIERLLAEADAGNT